MSFSGLKTAVLNCKKNTYKKNLFSAEDLASSFQNAVSEILCTKISLAIDISQERCKKFRNVVVSGGVAANNLIREKIEYIVKKKKKLIFFPPPNLCTDNGAMVAWAGYELYKKGITTNLNIKAKPRWPLETIGDKNE